MTKQILILAVLLGVSFQAAASDELYPEGAHGSEKYEAISAATRKTKGEITVEANNKLSYYDVEHQVVLRGNYKIQNDELHAVLDGKVKVFLLGEVAVHVELNIDLSRVTAEELQSAQGVEVTLDSKQTDPTGTTVDSKQVIFKHKAPASE